MHPWIEALAWLSLIGTLQGFFGNAYEAVVSVPNMMAIYELKLPQREPMFRNKRSSPVIYYVPLGALVLVLAVATALASSRESIPGRAWFAAAAALYVLASALTAYIVVAINLDLFFRPQANLEKARILLRRWLRWNAVRLGVLAASSAAWILGLRGLLIS